MKSYRRLVNGIVASLAVVAITSQAAVDNFDYGTSTSLFGQSGGSTSGSIAWTGSWGDQGFGTSAGLIQNTIGGVNGFNSTSEYAEYGLGSPGLESTRSFTSQSGQVVYVYGLMKVNNFNNANSFGGIGLFQGGTEKFLIGEPFSFTTWGAATANLNGANNGSAVSISAGVALLLAKIDQNANSLVLYVNPNFSLTEGANTSAFTLNYGTNNDDFDTIRIRAGNANNGNTWQFDNLNVTQSSPFIPEPSAIAMVMTGLIAVLARRWKA